MTVPTAYMYDHIGKSSIRSIHTHIKEITKPESGKIIEIEIDRR